MASYIASREDITTVKERNIEIEQARQLRQNIADHLDQRYSKLSDMFLSMDKNRAGTINVNELRQVCRNFNLDDRAIEKVIAWCDMDHNNVLSYDEFCKRLVQYDDGLLEKFLEGQEIDPQEIRLALRKATVSSSSATFAFVGLSAIQPSVRPIRHTKRFLH